METKVQNQSEVQMEAIDGSNKLHWCQSVLKGEASFQVFTVIDQLGVFVWALHHVVLKM
jgi:hypothetical protein